MPAGRASFWRDAFAQSGKGLVAARRNPSAQLRVALSSVARKPGAVMARTAFLIYGVIAYLLFVAAILYGIGFVANVVPHGIDGKLSGEPWKSAVIDVLLLGVFALQHNVMARPWFKNWWTRFVPQAIERSTFVAAASLVLFLLYWQWRPIPEPLWEVKSTALRALIWILYGFGWMLVFYSSFVIDHFELFGLKQVYRNYRGEPHETAPFSERSLYRWVRHPLMLGFLIAFWAAPTMTLGRLLFAGVTTAWILLSIQIEERDLVHFLGEPYRRYREQTPMILPLPRKAKGHGAGSTEA
jgi:protein-S-isoprenylcysteine O-methyltransferase Ste14